MKSSRAEFLERTRRAAWAFGRDVREGLLAQYRERYGVSVVPPPALIIDELLTDFLGARLIYLPLALNVYAQTEWLVDRVLVTVNSLVGCIPGVRDPGGVRNVAKWHEAIHTVHDIEVIRMGTSGMLPGFDAPPKIVCYRTGGKLADRDILRREYWAEEAGRAAAVSHEALSRSEAFRELLRLAECSGGRVRQGWPLLFRAASDIAVNSSALVKQLRLEGLIATPKDTSLGIDVQTSLPEMFEAG